MAELVRSLLGLIVRVGLLLAGLVFFASLLAAALVLLTLWLLRALWAKVTGQPVRPWVFQMNRRPPWQRADAPFGSPSTQAQDDVVDAEVRELRDTGDASDVTEVTDVQPKRVEPPNSK